ncbi:MAG: hypothetical protein ACI901_001814 [Octadecabacter sp.]|jgi:hypothetical protein
MWWMFIVIYINKIAAYALSFLRDPERVCPLRIRTILTELPMILPMVQATFVTVRSLLTVSLASASVQRLANMSLTRCAPKPASTIV